MGNIKLSIITVVYNAESLLELTLKSVRALNKDQVEYVVIDGASKDKTLEILNKNKDLIDYAEGCALDSRYFSAGS